MAFAFRFRAVRPGSIPGLLAARFALAVLFGAAAMHPVRAQPLPEATEPRTLTVSFLHLNVENLERSLTLYRDLLGLDVVTPPVAPRVATQLVDEPGALLQTVVLRVPGQSFQLELVQWHGVAVRPQQPRIQDPGAVMLVVNVRDLDAMLAGARQLGLQVLSAGGAPVAGVSRDGRPNRAVMVRDWDGFVVEFIEGSEPLPAQAKVGNLSFFLTVADLAQTVNFYNRTFGFAMPAPPPPPQPTPERIRKLFNDSTLTTVRMAEGTFPGAGSLIRFQEFGAPDRRAVRHRVQDPGGPIMPMTVQAFAAVVAAARATGGTIGTGPTSVDLPADARSTWIRDPNGMLFQVSVPRPAR